MTNYTYTDYTKFIAELTTASNNTFDMSKVANLLYNVHGIKEEICVSRCYSGDKSPFLNVFLTKDGTFKFVSNFKNEKEFNDATESYYNQYFQEFEELVMHPFYADGTIEPLSMGAINYDLISVITHADDYKLDYFKIGNEKHHYYYLPSYFVPLKKAKVLSVTKVKGSLDYKIRFRLTDKTFQMKYYTTANANDYRIFEASVKERVANGEDYPTVLADEVIKYVNTLTYIQEEIVPELKATIDVMAGSKNSDLAEKMLESLKEYVANPMSIVGPIMYPEDDTWAARVKAVDNGKPYIAYDRFTDEMTVHNVDKSNETIDYSVESVINYADNYLKNK